MNVLLLDNDLYYVLAATDTLDDFISILEIKDESIYVLPELRWEASKHTSRYPSEQSARCCELCRRFQSTILSQKEEELLSSFTQIDDINDGEAILFTRLLSSSDGVLLTKDTRFVTAIRKTSKDVQSAIHGKIIILEHILFALYQRYGHAYIVQKLSNYVQFDKKLLCLLSVVNQENEGSFKEGLESNIRQRIREHGLFLFPFEKLKN